MSASIVPAKKLLLQGNIIDGTGNPPFYGCVGINGNKIIFVRPIEKGMHVIDSFRIEEDRQIMDAGEGWLVPGFVDLHVHGGAGADVMDGNQTSLSTLCRFHLVHGTTSLAPTTMTASYEEIDNALKAVMAFKYADELKEMILGVHLEGPFISSRYPGAQNPKHISLARKEWIEEWVKRFPGLICQLTLAPELQGSEETVKFARQHGILVACGHSDATYEQMTDAVTWGLSHAVHCCNAMRPFLHRDPGVVGAVLLHEEITTEIIIDGHHLHPAAARLIHKVKQDKVCLVTDAMRASGMKDGTYQFSGLEVYVDSGVATIAKGNLAGSTLTMDQALRNFMEQTSLELHNAIRHATAIPAAIIGASANKGSILLNNDADLVILGRDTLRVERVMLGGQWVEL